MKSLAETLGLVDPPQRDACAPFEHLSGKAFAEAVLNSSEFRRYVVNGLHLGDLAPAILTRLMDHGWGKPIERFEVQAVHALDGMSPSELHQHLQERVESLRVMMHMLEPEDVGSVH